MAVDLCRIGPKLIHVRRINEDHLAAFDIVQHRFRNDAGRESSQRSDDNRSRRSDDSSKRVIHPTQAEIQILPPLEMAHAEHFRVGEQASDKLFWHQNWLKLRRWEEPRRGSFLCSK